MIVRRALSLSLCTTLVGCSHEAAHDNWIIHAFMITGIAAMAFYSMMVYLKRSPSFPRPSKVVVTALLLLAVVGALIPISQSGSEKLTLAHYAEIAYFAIGLPGLAVGIAIPWIFIFGESSSRFKN